MHFVQADKLGIGERHFPDTTFTECPTASVPLCCSILQFLKPHNSKSKTCLEKLVYLLDGTLKLCKIQKLSDLLMQTKCFVRHQFFFANFNRIGGTLSTNFKLNSLDSVFAFQRSERIYR